MSDLQEKTRSFIAGLLDVAPFFKILVLDEATQPIIATLFSRSALHHLGVTLVLRADHARDQISAPAFYFVGPDTVDTLVKDAQASLYNEYHLLVSGRLPRRKIEQLAVQLGDSRKAFFLRTIKDVPVNFVVHTESLFVSNAFESALEGLELFYDVARIGAPRKIARRMLVVEFERAADIAAPLRHDLSYSSLIHDILCNNLNSVCIEAENVNISDGFYSKYAHQSLSEIASLLEEELSSYRRDMAQAPKQVAGMIQELSLKNEYIQTHLKVSNALMERIRERGYDQYAHIEMRYTKELAGTLQSPEDVLRSGLYLLSRGTKLDLVVEMLERVGLSRKLTEVVSVEAGGLLGNVKKFVTRAWSYKSTEFLQKKFQEALETTDETEIEVVVLLVKGGGCYGEVSELVEWGKKSNVRVIYGCEDILRPGEWAEKIRKLRK